jgi:hypothetical protein
MALDVCVQRIIAATPEQVSSYAMDWRHAHEWTECIREAALTSPCPDGGFGLGAEITRAAQFLGRKFDYVLRVVSYEPPAIFDLKSVAGPMELRYTYRFEPHEDGGTLTSIRLRADPGGYYRLSEPLMTAQLRKSLRHDLADLDRHTTRP